MSVTLRCLTAAGEPSATPLVKRAFTGPTLTVVLGLEGSGHHGICAVLSANGAAKSQKLGRPTSS